MKGYFFLIMLMVQQFTTFAFSYYILYWDDDVNYNMLSYKQKVVKCC